MFVNTQAASNCSDGLERSESKVDYASSEYICTTPGLNLAIVVVSNYINSEELIVSSLNLMCSIANLNLYLNNSQSEKIKR